jgi:hypothetical protein
LLAIAMLATACGGHSSTGALPPPAEVSPVVTAVTPEANNPHVYTVSGVRFALELFSVLPTSFLLPCSKTPGQQQIR